MDPTSIKPPSAKPAAEGEPAATSSTLTLPGWRGSGPTHWQSRWEALHGCHRVEQADWEWPRRGDWMARLDEAVQGLATPVRLVAHSLGCQLVAAWAAHSAHADRVQAALLVAIPDTERPDMPPQLAGWRVPVRRRLPFPALVLAGHDDPYCRPERSRGYADDWGADWRDLGPLGHLNAESGLGDWPAGWSLWTGWLERSPTTARW